MQNRPITVADVIFLAIAVALWLIFLFGTNVAG
jgi:hypothetical protein